MYYTIIKFPFSSVNDHGYTLWVCLNASGDMTSLCDAIAADSEVFRRKPTQIVTGDTIYNFEGTLSGSVKVTDDEREDFWTPLVCSKLSFNMACETFPVWLMEYCNNNRAKVILTKDDAKPHVMWHGYLIAQTLNMTVVRNLMACPMVAVDEVAMAKYMNFKETLEYVTTDHWCSVFGLMEHFHSLHHTRGLSDASPGFEKLYYILNLSHSNRLLWHRNLAIQDSNGTDINDLPGTLMVNLDRWLQDKEATWEECLTELCEYLGVTFAVGSYGLMTNCDAYLLTCPTDSPTVQQFVYTFDNHSVVSHSNSQYATLNNPTKLGGNLQITAEPDRYKAVEVTSVPERWKGHDYLTEGHYKEIAPDKQVRFEWGEKDDPGQYFKNMEWHKLKYTKPDVEEAEFVELAPCADGEGLIMARAGELPYVNLNSCTGKTEPDMSVADSLDFITFKEGCCCVKIGQGEPDGIDEDTQLKPYFLIMNHNWDNMFEHAYHTMETLHLADTTWLTLWPLGGMKAIHPSDRHYLKAKIDVMFIRENMPEKLVAGNRTYLFLKAPNASTPNQLVDWTTPAILMPSERSAHNFEDAGDFNASLALWYDLYFQAYIRIGNCYYNGTNWEFVASGQTPPKCDVTLWNDTNETTSVTNIGQRVIETKSYYYTISNPYRGTNLIDRYTNQTKLLTNLVGYSIHNQPLHGQLEMQVLGQIRLQHGNVDNPYNSIPFVLLSNIEINYTDDAELMGKDIELKQKSVMDATSNTKQTLERSIKMSSPQVDGFFSNAMLFDNGKAWQNLRQVKVQGALPLLFTPEWSILQRLSWQYGSGQLYVELETPVAYDDNVHNIDFTVTNLTEAKGDFMPLRRVFDYTLDRMRVKLMRINMPLQPVTLVSIKAQYVQSGVVVGTDSLDTLKQYLTVTATYSDSTTRVLDASEYTLSGTLAYPSATVTVQYQGESDMITVAVAYDAQVEYLQSTGEQWIDTGIVLQENDVVEIEAMFLNKSGDNMMMGSVGNGSEGSIWIEVYGNKTHYVRFGSSTSAYQSNNAIPNMNVWRTYKIEKGHFYVDGVQKLTPNYVSMPGRTLLFFGQNSNTPTGGVVRIRAARIIRGGLPILDLSSVRLGSVGYMYDSVTDALMPNNGVFQYGNDV